MACMASNDAPLSRRRPSDYPFHLSYRSRWSDNDMYAHLNNTTYAHLYDSVINAYLVAHCGLTLPSTSSSPPSSQIGLVVSSSSRYFSPVSFPAVLDLGLCVTRLGRSSVSYEVGVFEEEEDEVKAVGGLVHVFVEREGRRPGRDGMAEGLRRGLERIVVAGEKARL